MNVVLSKENYHVNNIIFGNKTPNNIIENSYFYTIHYSDELIYLNHIVYKISFNNFTVEEYYNKFKNNFKYAGNEQAVSEIIQLEQSILALFSSSKRPSFKMKEQCSKQFCKVTIDTKSGSSILLHNLSKEITQPMPMYIKISGIWETKDEYGIIYKFFF